MRQPIWKLAALVGISGFGFLGLLQVQKSLHDRGVAEAAELSPEAPAQKVGTARVVSKSSAPGRVRIQQTAAAASNLSATDPAGIDFRDQIADGELVRAGDADLRPIPGETAHSAAFGKAAFERHAKNGSARNRADEPKPIITPAGFDSPSKPKPIATAAADAAAAPETVPLEPAAASPAPAAEALSDFGPDPFAAFGPSPDAAASGFEERPEPLPSASPSELLGIDDPFADPPGDATSEESAPVPAEPAATPADDDPFGTPPTAGAPADSPATQPTGPAVSDDPFGDSPAALPATDDIPADETSTENELAPVPEAVDEAGPVEPATSPSPFGFDDDPFGDAPSSSETPAATDTEGPAPTEDAPSPIPTEPAVLEPTQEEPSATAEPAAGDSENDPFGGDPFESAPMNAEPMTVDPSLPAAESAPSDVAPSELDFGDGTSVPLRPVTGTDTPSPSAEPAAPSAGEGPRRLPDESDFSGVGTVSPDDPQGPQSAQLTVEKKAPASATLGQPLVYEIIVTNVGKSPAHEVTVSDVVPKGMTLGGTSPRAAMEGKMLVWKLDTLEPGESTSIKIKATPVEAGMLGSVATVTFVSEVAARTEVVAPHLTLKVSVPPQVALGQPVDFRFEIGNDGNAAAEGVLLRNVLPEGFRHADGNDLEYEVGTLPPGKTEAVTLRVAAVKAGSFKNNAMITATGGLKSEAVAEIEVADQKVTVTRQGPKRRYVGRPAMYANTVKNASQEIVSGVKVIEQVPAGLEFVQASHGGQFDPDKRTVAWQVGPLRPGQEQTLQVVLTAAEEGVQDSVVHVEESSGGSVEVASATEVSALPSLAPTMQTPDGPIIVGERAVLQIHIRNRGNADATAVSIALGLPPQLKLIEARGGQVAAMPDGKNVIQFRAPLAAGGEQTVQFIVEGASPGPARVHAEVAASHMAKPLVKDEELVVTARR